MVNTFTLSYTVVGGVISMGLLAKKSLSTTTRLSRW